MSSVTDLQVVSLRYFNPIGADPAMRSGIHVKRPSHVIGKLLDVANGTAPSFSLTGTGWPTRDGSGIRDYIHVWDLAQAHVEAVVRFSDIFRTPAEPEDTDSFRVINLGSGSGVTVKELVAAFEDIWGKKIAVTICGPRAGDVAGAFASREKALRLLDWAPKLTLHEAIRHTVQWNALRAERLGYV